MQASEYELFSPDRLLKVVVGDDGGLHYSAEYKGKAALLRSPLGIFRDDVRTDAGALTISGALPLVSGRTTYDNQHGKCSRVDKPYVEQEFMVAGGGYSVLFRLYNQGFAFAYRLAGHGSEVKVYGEATGFAYPQDAKAFLTQMAKAKSGWEHTNPSYEDSYHIDVPVNEISEHRQGWVFPALVHHDGIWTLISETGTTAQYVGCHLTEADGGVFGIAFPEAGHNLPSDPTWAQLATPAQTPWRMVVVTDDIADIACTTLADDLVEPQYAAKVTAQPGKAAWSWLYYGDSMTTVEGTQEHIDLAARLGFPYCLIDAQWDQQIGRDAMARLADYARTKNVRLMLWYNSNGKFNTAPQTPMNLMNTSSARKAEMAWLKKIGVAGIKVDFFGGDKQAGMQLYEDILRDANDAGLLVVLHGTTLPRGWQRMYPAFANAEAVMGQEFCRGEKDKEAMRPRHSAVLPFVRNAVAPMDFTPVVLGEKLGPNGWESVRATTAGFELALPVVFFEPMSHYGITPADIKHFPDYVWSYFRSVPTVWDETRLLSGYPGRDVVMARRSGKKWYVAGINGEPVDKDLQLDLSQLGKPTKATLLYTSRPQRNAVEAKKLHLGQQAVVGVHLSANDGFVMMIE